MPKRLVIIGISAILLTGCWMHKSQGVNREGSQTCRQLKQRINYPDYQHHSTGPYYTPADEARLIQEYQHIGCE